MASARAIVMAIGATQGVRWEIGALVANGHLAKTIFLFPPTTEAARHERWQFTVEALNDAHVLLPPLAGDPGEALTATLGKDGQWHVATAAVRDEASYRVAVDVAMATAGELGRVGPPARQ